MTDFSRPGVIWITGASSGIGRALALACAARGWTVAASARNEADLDQLTADATSGRIIPYRLDVTDPDAVVAAAAAIESEVGPIDLAIFNAGTHIPVSATHFDRDAVAKLVETNLMGTVNCLSAIMPPMIVRRRGEIAVMASMTGYRGLPTSAGYGATKAALINMCEALKPELDLHNVAMRLINPGFVDTPLTRRNPFPMPFLTPVDKAAETILRKLSGKRFEITVPWQMMILLKLLRFVPNGLAFAVTRRITPDPNEADQTDRVE